MVATIFKRMIVFTSNIHFVATCYWCWRSNTYVQVIWMQRLSINNWNSTATEKQSKQKRWNNRALRIVQWNEVNRVSQMYVSVVKLINRMRQHSTAGEEENWWSAPTSKPDVLYSPGETNKFLFRWNRKNLFESTSVLVDRSWSGSGLWWIHEIFQSHSQVWTWTHRSEAQWIWTPANMYWFRGSPFCFSVCLFELTKPFSAKISKNSQNSKIIGRKVEEKCRNPNGIHVKFKFQAKCIQ